MGKGERGKGGEGGAEEGGQVATGGRVRSWRAAGLPEFFYLLWEPRAQRS